MSATIEDPVIGSGEWVDLVNPSPVEQNFTNGSKPIGYGESCIAYGEVEKNGQLVTGEELIRVINPG